MNAWAVYCDNCGGRLMSPSGRTSAGRFHGPMSQSWTCTPCLRAQRPLPISPSAAPTPVMSFVHTPHGWACTRCGLMCTPEEQRRHLRAFHPTALAGARS